MPTIKQKHALKKSVENGGNVTKAMRDVGYSEATINNPSNLTQSKWWQSSMEKYLPDEDLIKVHKQGLQATKKIFKKNTKSNKIELLGEEPDFNIRHKYLDSAYKLKGRYVTKEEDAKERVVFQVVKFE